MPERYRILPPEGVLLASTDVHGSGEDFRRMRAIFEDAVAEEPNTHWAILGDIVHGPSDEARERRPDLYEYDDESGTIARELVELIDTYPDRVHFVLGNHDWAHVGGPATRKFYPDEAEHLESNLSTEEIETLHRLLKGALLCLITPCGAFLSHASPGALFDSLDELNDIELGEPLEGRQLGLVEHLTTYYGQRAPVCRSFLRHTSDLCDLDLQFVVHGHDRDEEGWFTHEDTQLCPVIFGAPRDNRRYLRLDLSDHYNLADITDGREILRLWAD